MRITNSIITSSAIRSMLISQRGMDAASKQVSSGLRVDRVSQDPTAGTQAMGASSELRALAQYRRNVERASSASDAQETTLNTLTDLLSRARELGISQATSTASTQTRQAVKQEVDQLLRMAVGLGNTQHDGAFLFGGSQSLTAPVTLIDGATPDFTVATTGAAMEYALSPGQRIRVNDTAQDIFGTTGGGALAALRALSLALDADDIPQINAAVADLRTAFDTVQDRLGETGARSNQLQVTRANVDALDVTLQAYKSQLVDVDVEQAITELVAKQTTYQAAMLATSRVIELNLTNYLR